MKKTLTRLIPSLLIGYPIIGLIVGLILYKYFPTRYFGLYPTIPIYYSTLGLILFISLIYYLKNSPEKIIHVYMMFRGIKFLITVAGILLFVSLSDSYEYEFTITTIGFYFFYLFVETYIFIKFEKERMARCKKEQ